MSHTTEKLDKLRDQVLKARKDGDRHQVKRLYNKYLKEIGVSFQFKNPPVESYDEIIS